MAFGPGKYDDVLTAARERGNLGQAFLIVLDGPHGPGFSCQCFPENLAVLPGMLRHMADEIEADAHALNQPPGEATCIGCGCTDSRACISVIANRPVSCRWLEVDRAAGLGVCSECPGELLRFRKGDRTMKAGNGAQG